MKRFVDTCLFDKEWFLNLTPSEKCAIFYLFLKCDNAGVWSVSKKIAEISIGDSINWDDLIEKSNGNIRVLSETKWWLIDFCWFQYKVLKEDTKSKPLLSYISLLKKHGLWGEYQNLIKEYT